LKYRVNVDNISRPPPRITKDNRTRLTKMTDSPLTITHEEYMKLDAHYSVKPSSYTKPIRLYLDVDGVIKPSVPNKAEVKDLFPHAVEIDVLPPFSWQNPLPLHRGLFYWDKEVIERLAALSHSPHVDVVWLTDWRVSAPHSLDELLGIKSVGFLEWERKFSDYSQAFKRVAIQDEQEESSSKFIWIDDRANLPYGDAPHPFAIENDDFEWEFDEEGNLLSGDTEAYHDAIPASQFLNVITDKYTGLTHDDMETIEKWVETNI
jgi:hypothetical protein